MKRSPFEADTLKRFLPSGRAGASDDFKTPKRFPRPAGAPTR